MTSLVWRRREAGNGDSRGICAHDAARCDEGDARDPVPTRSECTPRLPPCPVGVDTDGERFLSPGDRGHFMRGEDRWSWCPSAVREEVGVVAPPGEVRAGRRVECQHLRQTWSPFAPPPTTRARARDGVTNADRNTRRIGATGARGASAPDVCFRTPRRIGFAGRRASGIRPDRPAAG